MSHVPSSVAHVTHHFFSSSFFYKGPKLVGGGSVINKTTPSSFYVVTYLLYNSNVDTVQEIQIYNVSYVNILDDQLSK